LIGDLFVNTGKWMRGMSNGWRSTQNLAGDIDRMEAAMEPELAEKYMNWSAV
jgi:hypothetical protein